MAAYGTATEVSLPPPGASIAGYAAGQRVAMIATPCKG